MDRLLGGATSAGRHPVSATTIRITIRARARMCMTLAPTVAAAGAVAATTLALISGSTHSEARPATNSRASEGESTMAKRYAVQLMSWPYEQWAVWDRVQRREVSWLHHDRKVVAKMVREM